MVNSNNNNNSEKIIILSLLLLLLLQLKLITTLRWKDFLQFRKRGPAQFCKSSVIMRLVDGSSPLCWNVEKHLCECERGAVEGCDFFSLLF
jgi:hypothetical protein